MHRCLIPTLFCMLIWAGSAHAATVQQVDQAIHRAAGFIYSKQQPNGSWELAPERTAKALESNVLGGQFGGLTALSTYALLAAGEDSQEPRIQKAVKWLKTTEIVGVYALGLRCQVWLLLPQTNETRLMARQDAQLLEKGFATTGKGTFLYPYTVTRRNPLSVDHSSSQFGVLGMWACTQCGCEIPDQYWRDVEQRWNSDQQPDGSWLYGDKPTTTDPNASMINMTAAGVATLFITQDYVHMTDGITCRGNLKNDHIDHGLNYITAHSSDWFQTRFFGDKPSFLLTGYTLYGLERIGVASGLKYFGSIDWYQLGAERCVKSQDHNGSFSNNIPNTALITLFLARGRAPIVIDKVQYDLADSSGKSQPGHWNQRPRDVANFVHWMSRNTERDLNWQITSLDVPEAELHEAPILYLAGNQAISLTPSQQDKLRQFALHGGMVLANSDCGSAGASNKFTTAMEKLGETLFPGYHFRDLPKDHPIFTNEQYPASTWKSKVVLRGLSNGVRELMIILPTDPAKLWQMQTSTGSGKVEAFQSVNDIVLYATDKQRLKVKGDSFLLVPDPSIKAKRTVNLARLQYQGNWDPEPGGWDQLAATLHNQHSLDLSVKPVLLGKDTLGGYRIAHLTGTGKLVLTDSQQQELTKFVQAGGTLLVDAAGGNFEFAASTKALLQKLFIAGQPFPEPLAAADPLFTLADPKAHVSYRQYARAILGGLKTPELVAIKIDGRNAVYFSREDLSAGLVGEAVDGIIGYDPASATDIVSSIVLMSASAN